MFRNLLLKVNDLARFDLKSGFYAKLPAVNLETLGIEDLHQYAAILIVVNKSDVFWNMLFVKTKVQRLS